MLLVSAKEWRRVVHYYYYTLHCVNEQTCSFFDKKLKEKNVCSRNNLSRLVLRQFLFRELHGAALAGNIPARRLLTGPLLDHKMKGRTTESLKWGTLYPVYLYLSSHFFPFFFFKFYLKGCCWFVCVFLFAVGVP